MTQDGLSDFLVLLGIRKTCKQRGVSFLKFLQSGQDDVESYCQRSRSKNLAAANRAEAKGRTIAVGDIHGCSKALGALLGVVAPGVDDTAIALGNYVEIAFAV
jgi:hypothetical protein